MIAERTNRGLVIKWLRTVGFLKKDNFKSLHEVKKNSQSLTYNYYDILGKKIYCTVKGPGKQFRQYHFINGKPIPGSGNGQPVVYNLRSFFKKDTEVIYFVEGEKDADSLASFDIPATNLKPLSALKKMSQTKDYLKGKDRK